VNGTLNDVSKTPLFLINRQENKLKSNRRTMNASISLFFLYCESMNSLIENISLQWDLWSGQFRAYFPSYEDDLKACRELFTDDAPDQLPKNQKALLVACQDSRAGQMAACMRLADAHPLKEHEKWKNLLQLELIEEKELQRMAVFSELAIHPEHDKSAAVLLLLSHCFVEVLRAGGSAILMSCDPEHFSLYKRLGMRPVGPLQQLEEGQYRIPMIGLPDQDYLSIIHSPVLPMLRGINFENYKELCNWYYHLVRENSGLRVSSAFYPDEDEDFEGHHSITEGLSEAGQAAFLKQAMIINAREDEVLISENDGGKAFGYIRHGLVKVVIGGEAVVLLGEGDIFGEIAFILNTKRTAQVVSASARTEVVLFNDRAINSLEKESDRTVIWRNLARVLAQRVVLTNQLLSE